jgi:hypothetical protein
MVWNAHCRSRDAIGREPPSRVLFDASEFLGSGLRSALGGGVSYAATGSQKPSFAIWVVLDIPTSLLSSAETGHR